MPEDDNHEDIPGVERLDAEMIVKGPQIGRGKSIWKHIKDWL